MSACDRNQLLLLAAGELNPAEREAAERHVAGCPACTAELAALREGLAAVDELAAPEPTAEACDRIRLLAADRMACRRTVRPAFVRRYRWAIGAAAAVALVIGYSLWSDRANPQPEARGPVLTAGQLDRLWNGPAQDAYESLAMTEDLAGSYGEDEWTRTAEAIAAAADSERVFEDLFEIEQDVEFLENRLSAGS